MRSTHLCEAHVRAQLIRKRRTPEGEIINYAPQELAVSISGCFLILNLNLYL